MTAGEGREFPAPGSSERSAALRASFAVGAATGAYGVSFGAISVASGLNVAQTCALSLLMFSGGSQFALVGVLAGGGSTVTAVSTAAMLGARNTFYGIRLASLLRVRGVRRLLGAQLVVDESTAVATGQPTEPAARLGFWATGVSVFVLWNLATLLGALGAGLVSDPRVLGLDAAAPAAFLALLAPRMRTREPWAVALAAAVVALAAAPYLPAGVPVLLAGGTAIAVGLARRPAATDDAAAADRAADRDPEAA